MLHQADKERSPAAPHLPISGHLLHQSQRLVDYVRGTALGDAPVAPENGTLVGTTDVVQVGVVVLRLSRGTGPTLHNYWTGYWNAAGN